MVTCRGFKSFTGYLQGQVDYFNKTMGVPPKNPRVQGFDFWHGEVGEEAAGKQSKEYREAVGAYSLEQYRAALKGVLAPYGEASGTALARAAPRNADGPHSARGAPR